MSCSLGELRRSGFCSSIATSSSLDTPIVFYASNIDTVRHLAAEPVTGVLNPDVFATTMELALRLHPDATEAFIISGTPMRDKLIEREASQQFEEFKNRVKITYLTDLSYEELLATVRSLPKRSVILYARATHEDPGVGQGQGDSLDAVSRAAPVPVYCPWRSLLGFGSVGGIVDDPVGGATKAAEIALRVARGARPQDIPTDRTPKIPSFDARQLARWGISERALPAGSVVLFKVPTLWSQYRHYVIGTGLALALQTLLIGMLLVQRARRRRVENALRESEERFRLMADTAPVMIWRANVDKACDFVNRPWLEFRGRTMEEEAGSGWAEGIHPEDFERCWTTYQWAFDERRTFAMEYRLRRADGEYRWVLDTGIPRFAPDGAFAGYIGTCIDITERRKAAEALQDSEKRYALATAAGSVGVWEWNVETDAMYVDPALMRSLGVLDHETVDHPDGWRSRVHPADAARLRADLMACVDRAAVSFENEHRMLHRDDSIRWFLARGSAILLPDGRVGGLIGTIIDITERKRAEARLHEMQDELARVSKLTALGEYAASIAHEISQPLSGILMNSTVALRCLEGPVRKKESEIRVALQEIVNDGERARELMRRNRELFQHHTVEKTLLDVNSVVRAVAEIARMKLQHSRVTVQFTLSEGLPAVLGDRMELQQVLLNLILNGIDAMEGVGSPSRQLQIDTRLTDGNMVRITVRDKGLGLEDVDAERIFKPLYTTKPTGTGVGLFICRSIVEVHGGKVWVERNDGPGAAFCFTIPAAGTGVHAPATQAAVVVGD